MCKVEIHEEEFRPLISSYVPSKEGEANFLPASTVKSGRGGNAEINDIVIEIASQVLSSGLCQIDGDFRDDLCQNSEMIIDQNLDNIVHHWSDCYLAIQLASATNRLLSGYCRTGRKYCYKRSGVHLPLSWVCIEVIYKRLDISTGRQYCYSGARVHLTLSWVCIEVIYKCLDISWIYINVQDRSAILLQRSSSPFDAQLDHIIFTGVSSPSYVGVAAYGIFRRYTAPFDVQGEFKIRINNAITPIPLIPLRQHMNVIFDVSDVRRQLLGFDAKRRGVACVTSLTWQPRSPLRHCFLDSIHPL
ncbi:hypothetical protein J6590_096801 [Homalodisca vitripennis]|nr:hypothetical protein J6590_096801 [Homalodisca vitripennis]